jgi:hypothetical protein
MSLREILQSDVISIEYLYIEVTKAFVDAHDVNRYDTLLYAGRLLTVETISPTEKGYMLRLSAAL